MGSNDLLISVLMIVVACIVGIPGIAAIFLLVLKITKKDVFRNKK